MKQLAAPAFTVFGEPRNNCAVRAARAPGNRSRQRSGRRRQSDNTDRHRWTEPLPSKVGAGKRSIAFLPVDERRADRGRRGRPEGQLVRDHVASPSGGRRYRNAFATDLEVGRDTVEDLARCARARWKVENNAFGILEDSFNLERNFGHGRDALAGLLAIVNIISLLMQNACDLRCKAWKAARARLAAR